MAMIGLRSLLQGGAVDPTTDIQVLVAAMSSAAGGAVGSDVWSALKSVWRRRSSTHQGDTEVETLEAARVVLAEARAAGDVDTVRAIESAWADQIRLALAMNPAFVDELRSVLKPFEAAGSDGATRVVNNNFASENARIVAGYEVRVTFGSDN